VSFDYTTLFICTITFFWRFDHMNLAFLTRLPRIGSLAALVSAGALIAAPGLANAGTISFSYANQTPVTTAGGSGTIDVVVTDTTNTDTLFQFNVESFLTNHGGSNISLNAAQETGAPVPPGSAGGFTGGTSGYVFGQSQYANSNDVTGGGQIGVNSTTDVQNSDSDVTSGTLLGGGTQYGMMQLEFTVPPGTAAGSYVLSFNTDDPNTDGDYINLVSKSDFTHYLSPNQVNGAIFVTGPEPASVVMMIMGAIGFIGIGLRRRARRA